MDANGLRFWMLSEATDWTFSSDQLEYDTAQRRLRLRSQRALPDARDVPNERNAALQRLADVPACLDAFGATASWDATAHMVVAHGPFRDVVPIWSTAPTDVLTDLSMGFDGVLYLADESSGNIVLIDRRERWTPATVHVDGVAPWRLAADPTGGVWVLDRSHRRVGRVRGYPLRARPFSTGTEDFQACEPNPNPPRIVWETPADWLPPEEDPVAIACSSAGRVAVLVWRSDGSARLHIFGGDTADLAQSRFPYSLAWVDDTRVAILQPTLPREAGVYEVGGGALQPVGEIYPLRDHADGPFVHTLSPQPRYFTTDGELVPLSPLSLPSFAVQGEATNPRPIDSGDPRTTWHRAYVEACIPAGCGLRVLLAATNSPTPPTSDVEWHTHLFGDRFDPPGPGEDARIAPPRAAWLPAVSEVPLQGGLLQCPPVRDRVGLFTVLVQRSRRASRSLRGRYLWVRLELLGNRLSTPDVAALRVYASRFSYVERYLPELYQETLFGADADHVLAPDEQSTPADFLERFLGIFEGVLTPLEDTIASAYLVTDPRSAPAEGLEWLASWIGLGFAPGYPVDQRRALIAAAPALYRQHGTLAGMCLALDVATDGARSRSSIVVVEDFRLRRTAATILGANLADTDDPLLAGLSVSGNSFVGDTLLLGDEHRDEFLAVFGPDVATRSSERAAVAAFFDQLAHRVTVLVHRDTPSDELGLIRRIVDLETPAHVESRIATASDAFLVGVAALIAIDTTPGPSAAPQAAEIERSYLGWRDLVLGMPSLDPRLEAGGSVLPAGSWQRPVAAAHGATAAFGAPFTLDGSGSHAATGRELVDYRWSLTGPA